jgi:antitoxin MazE
MIDKHAPLSLSFASKGDVSTLLTLDIPVWDTGCALIDFVWRTNMKATVKKWGNSAAVRIPASVMQAMHLDLNEVVDVREEAGRIVIEPVRQKTYELGRLLKGITSKNQHRAVDFGAAVGKEVW